MVRDDAAERFCVKHERDLKNRVPSSDACEIYGTSAMQERKDTAIQKAEEFIATSRHPQGPCIGVRCITPTTQTIWEVEFAHAGFTSRSETADPPSLILVVDLDRNSVRVDSLM